MASGTATQPPWPEHAGHAGGVALGQHALDPLLADVDRHEHGG